MNECPNCSGKLQAVQEEERAAEQPPVATPPPQLGKTAATVATPGKTWLMSLLFAALFIALGVGIYWGVRHWKNRPAAGAAQPAALENPPAAGQGGPPSSVAKFIQITGVRLTQTEKKKTQARFLVVNHSSADVAELSGTVTLRARGADSPVGTFSFKSLSLDPHEAKEAVAPVDTSLRVYELPDWQNLIADLKVTSP